MIEILMENWRMFLEEARQEEEDEKKEKEGEEEKCDGPDRDDQDDEDDEHLLGRTEDELSEISGWHDSKGRFSSKANAKTYSLSQRAVDDLGDDSELEAPLRGRATSGGKVSARYNMNVGGDEKQCGRLRFPSGGDKKKSRSCQNYPKKYWEVVEEEEEEKEETKRKNRYKNRNDAIPRKEDSPSVRREKVFPGSHDLHSLGKGIVSTREGIEREEAAVLNPGDEVYIKALISKEIKRYFDETDEPYGVRTGCSWKEIMQAYQDITTAAKGKKEDKS